MMLRRFLCTSGFTFPAPRALESVVKKDLLENESSSKITEIWEKFHQEKDDCVAKVMKADIHSTLMQRGKECPFFVFPVQRSEGLFTMLSQFQENYILMTYLEAFKQNPAQAPPYLAISIYDDLIESKNLSLLRGDIVNELDKAESTRLIENLIAYYTEDEKYETVLTFNKQPTQFDFEDYMQSYPTINR